MVAGVTSIGGKFWLAGDAAASYLRMFADSGNLTGLAAAGRTREQQAALYDAYLHHGGNLAAKPGHSLHESGLAIDVTRKSQLQVWMVAGGSTMSVHSGEKIRAQEYGWFRTVPSEAWHFRYYRAKDKHRSAALAARLVELGYSNVKAFQEANGLVPDGVDGPLTWRALLTATTPDPTPTPAPSIADFKVGQINLELWGGTQTTASFDARGKWLHDKMRCSVYLLCETSPALPSFPGDMRARLLALLGGSWKVEAWQEIAVAYDGAKWRLGGTPRIAKYGVYQGALLVPLVHIDTGIGVDMVSVHVRPGKVATDEEKRAEIQAAFGLAKGWPVVIGGDWNTSAVRDMLPPGFVAATPDVQTQAAGRLDHVFVRSGTTGTVAVRTAVQKDPGALSDHLGWIVGVTITNQPSTL